MQFHFALMLFEHLQKNNLAPLSYRFWSTGGLSAQFSTKSLQRFNTISSVAHVVWREKPSFFSSFSCFFSFFVSFIFFFYSFAVRRCRRRRRRRLLTSNPPASLPQTTSIHASSTQEACNPFDEPPALCPLLSTRGHDRLIQRPPLFTTCTKEEESALYSGHDATTGVLLMAGADREARNSYQQTPLQVAVECGKLETCQQLVDKGAQIESPSDTKTVLHSAAQYGHETIARYLIQQGVTIDKRDEKGRTALDLACELGKKEVARVLLETYEWESLMTPQDVIPLDRHRNPEHLDRNTPFRILLRKFPDLAVIVMDKCIRRSKEEEDETQCVEYRFDFIDDTYMSRVASDDGEREQLIGYKSPYNDEFKLEKDTQAYSSNYDRIYRNHPLKLMANAEKLSLLSHPLSMALIKYKWNKLGRVMYYSALMIYLIFIISLTEFVRFTKAPYNVENGDGYFHYNYFDENETCPQINVTKPDFFWKRIVQILAICQIVIECFQLYQRKFAYLTNWENWVDCFIYSTALLTVYDFTECSSTSGVRLNWQWLLAALCIFFGWINLLFMIRKMPRFGIFVVMFVDIVKTFFRFFPVFVLFIIAFSSSFYVLFQNRTEFSSVFMAPLKTTVMMIGEFEFAGIFHGDDASHTERMFGSSHTAVAYALFFSFCIIMTILLMNLLVGLAVDDIKGVQEKAELRRLAMQVDLVLQIEASIHIFITKLKKYSTNRYAMFPAGKLHKTGLAGWWSNFRR
ncbi:hypothetical protein CAEBREN_31497, partial [Caenorhabditis brenneri]